MQKQIAAANWKMNLGLDEAIKLINELQSQQLSLAVPYPYLLKAKEMLQGKGNFAVAAQNCASKSNGAYTGEVSAAMLASIGIQYVIIGHSERREYYSETNEVLAQKIDQAFEHGLHPVFCCGEPLQVREAGDQNAYVETQLKESLFHLSADKLHNFIIAYEPIWAIGTGKTASSDQAQEMHHHIRNVMRDKYGEQVAGSLSILYGGSVKGSNAKDIFSKPDVDGGLVGGASLNAQEFATIINSLKR